MALLIGTRVLVGYGCRERPTEAGRAARAVDLTVANPTPGAGWLEGLAGRTDARHGEGFGWRTVTKRHSPRGRPRSRKMATDNGGHPVGGGTKSLPGPTVNKRSRNAAQMMIRAATRQTSGESLTLPLQARAVTNGLPVCASIIFQRKR